MDYNQSKKHKVLIIEDNDLNCEILDEMLNGYYSLLFAKNGKEGMDMFHEHYGEIDVTLLDIQMPIMDGYEVLKAKSKEPLLKDIPVIITTSSNGKDDERRCLELGAQDFVRKPYDLIAVRLRIESIINLRESNEANRQKALFIQKISHEIRTPMNAIMGFAQVMENMADALSPEDLKMFSGNIASNSHSLLDMMNNMVILSDTESNAWSLSLSTVYPNMICKSAMEKAAYCKPANVNVSFSSDVDDSFAINANAKYLKEAVYNYILNAHKFTSKGDIRIHCTDKEKPGMLTISVTDTGKGVPSDKVNYIFERYTKLDEFVPGLGLGLAIARNIAISLKGSAYLDQNYHYGARFVLEIPINK